jgi:hypothetical protein
MQRALNENQHHSRCDEVIETCSLWQRALLCITRVVTTIDNVSLRRACGTGRGTTDSPRITQLTYLRRQETSIYERGFWARFSLYGGLI